MCGQTRIFLIATFCKGSDNTRVGLKISVIKPRHRSQNTDTNHDVTKPKPWVAQRKEAVPKTAISIHPVFTNCFLQNHLLFGLASDRFRRCFMTEILHEFVVFQHGSRLPHCNFQIPLLDRTVALLATTTERSSMFRLPHHYTVCYASLCSVHLCSPQVVFTQMLQ